MSVSKAKFLKTVTKVKYLKVDTQIQTSSMHAKDAFRAAKEVTVHRDRHWYRQPNLVLCFFEYNVPCYCHWC